MEPNFNKDPLLEIYSPVVAHNLQMMDEDMQDAWPDEPIGEELMNGKTHEIYRLYGYADKESGEIFAFIGGNKHVSQEIKVKGIRFTFIARNYFDIKKGQDATKISDFSDVNDFSALGIKHIKESIKAYNDSH